MSADPTRPLPQWGYPEPPTAPRPPRPRRRRRRGPFALLITLIVIVVLLVVSDRVANAFTESQMASQVQSSLGLSAKPDVTIHGFPFWTQLAARDFKNVTITASNETASKAGTGDRALEISSLNATLDGLHIHGTSSATVDQFNATALITFQALKTVGGIPQGVTLTSDGGNQIKASLSLGPFSASAAAEITVSGTDQISVKVTDFGGLPTSALGNLSDFTFTIPKLPSGVAIQSVSVTQQGVLITLTGHDTLLSKNS